MADQFFHQGQQGSSFGGCQQGGEEDRVVHGGVLSRSVGHSKNLHDALENTAFQAKKVLTVRELSPAKKRKQRFFLGNFWNAVTAPPGNRANMEPKSTGASSVAMASTVSRSAGDRVPC